MNNFIVSGKGFLKSVEHNKENNHLVFEWSRNVRDACKYKTYKVAENLIEKHQLDAFVWNPYKEEPIVGKFGIKQRSTYIDYNDYETKHKILEWIPERIVMENKTDVKFLSSKGIDERTIPEFHKHDLQLSHEGIGSRNNKEYCECLYCKKIRERRDKIFNSIIYRFYRWYNLNF